MKKTELKEVSIKKEVITELICDECGDEIQGDFYSVFSGHNDWYKDSEDSYAHTDYCCIDCLKKAFNDFFTNGYGATNRSFFKIRPKYFKRK